MMLRGCGQGFLFRGLPILAVVAAACGSTPEAPIPDPGGPFQTTVPATEVISKLSIADANQLCNDLTVAYRTFLSGGLVTEETCRNIGIEAAVRSTDGGTFQEDAGTYQANCQAAYDQCQRQQIADPLAYSCPAPVPGCNATVELLSACLNEIAAAEPLRLCIEPPSCDMISEGQTITPTTPPKLADLPPTPACDRFNRQCPSMAFSYPCGSF